MKEMIDQAARGAAREANWTLLPAARGNSRQKGVFAILFVVLLIPIIGFYGLALDLSRIYSRKAEMQSIAENIAVAAARKLNGTKAGIDDALAAAGDVLEHGQNDFRPKYGYAKTMTWSKAAIKFGRSADGGSTGWLDSDAASASPSGIAFVKVDTGALDPAYGQIDMLFMPALSSSLTTVNISHTAVAGRGRLNVTPLGICAMAPTPSKRQNVLTNATYDELVEYGFRRGVSYNLMNLNPDGGVPVHYLVDPIALSGSNSSATDFSIPTVTPYVCTGTMAVPKLVGETVRVQAGFPLSSLVDQLNARLDVASGCDYVTAPPDANVKQYTAGASLPWMSPKPTSQAAATDPAALSTTPPRLQTVADAAAPISLTAANSGPLWAYARAVPWISYVPGQPEPAGGYNTFNADATTWNKLYGPAVGPAYPTTWPTPYSANSGSTFYSQPAAGHRPGSRNRRVLNVPLLACPVTGSTATVLAIGKFFMTAPAVAPGRISAEFAGATTDTTIGGSVELYQ
jgi:hypothetical protein